jgi:hypothetical protein
MVCSSVVVGVTAAREAGLFRGLEADDSAIDGAADMEFDGVWPSCALTVVRRAQLHQHSHLDHSDVVLAKNFEMNWRVIVVAARWQNGLQFQYDHHQAQAASCLSSSSLVRVQRATVPTGACASTTRSMAHPHCRRGSAQS